MNSPLKQNITSLQNLLEQINSLPEAGGVELPELSNEGSANDLMFGKRLIDSNGNVVNGSFTIDNELNTQDYLIAKIQTTLQNKAVSGDDTTIEDGMITGTLSSYFNDRITYIRNHAFANCSSLTTANFPAVTSIGNNAFSNCTNLATINFPVSTSIGNYAFGNCTKLVTANLPNATTIGNNVFYYCTSLTTVSFPAAMTIGDSVFYKCYRLTSLYLTGSSVCELSTSKAFISTPIGGYSNTAGTYGSIYVPASLLTSYQKATNWTYFSSIFVGI